MRTLLSLVLSGTLLLAACGSTTDDDGSTADEREPTTTPSLSVDGTEPAVNLENARTLWEQAGIEDYAWTVQRICYCPPLTADITVKGDAVGSVSPVGPGRAQADPDLAVNTMEELFAFIAEELKAADEVSATYDPETGAVQKVDVDRLKGAADDEMGYVVKKFRPQG